MDKGSASRRSATGGLGSCEGGPRLQWRVLRRQGDEAELGMQQHIRRPPKGLRLVLVHRRWQGRIPEGTGDIVVPGPTRARIGVRVTSSELPCKNSLT